MPRRLTASMLAYALGAATIALGVAGVRASRVGAALLLLQLPVALAVYCMAVQRTRGTRRAVFAGMAGAALMGTASYAALGVAVAAFHASTAGAAMGWAGIVAQLCLTAGLAAALGRQRSWMRFEALTDALLLVAAAAIVLAQLDTVTGAAAGVSLSVRVVSVGRCLVATTNLVLVALLLAWRGELLGTRLATGLALGMTALAASDFIYSQHVMSGASRFDPTIAVLWTLRNLFFVWAAGVSPRQKLASTGELPAYPSDGGRVRVLSIVIAIVISAGSAASLGFRHDATPGLGLAVAAFGLLLALRVGHALWAQQRVTVTIERSLTEERTLATTLEHRVAERTGELAEAQRVLQRMWTLGQQIAVELNAERLLRCFLEAAVDVVRADGAAIQLDGRDGTLQFACAIGVMAPLQGRSFPLVGSAMGEVLRTGTPLRYEDLTRARGVGPEIQRATAAPVRGFVIVPIVRSGERIGVVAVGVRHPRAFTNAEVAQLETMADLLSVALANAQLVENMRRAEWRFRTLFRAAPDAVLTMYESGRIVEANDAVRDVLGTASLQLVGQTLAALAVPEDRGRVEAAMARAFAGAPVRLEARFAASGGAPRTLSLAARRLPEADPATVLCVGRDVTAERDMRARLAEAERLAAVGELVAGVAHEVNNPLSTISAFAQLLLRDDALTAEQRDSIDVIRAETVRASQVVKDLLTFARRSESQRRPLDLNEIVERAVRLRGYDLATSCVSVERNLEPYLPAVPGDARQLQQVVLNLVTNAAQAMAAQGGGTLRLTTRADGDAVVLDVADSGPGIAEDARGRVFEPFFTTKQEGTGLGLSVTYGIVAAHGGSIEVAETSAAGTTFRVRLRAGAGAADEAPDVGTIDDEGSPLEGARVLFVDDEPALRAGVAAFGRMRHIEVVTAEDGVVALDLLRRRPFDAVICDLRMPRMDGPALYEALRRENPTLAARTVFVTGDVVSPDSHAFVAATTQPVLQKPFDFHALERTLAELMRVEALGVG